MTEANSSLILSVKVTHGLCGGDLCLVAYVREFYCTLEDEGGAFVREAHDHVKDILGQI